MELAGAHTLCALIQCPGRAVTESGDFRPKSEREIEPRLLNKRRDCGRAESAKVVHQTRKQKERKIESVSTLCWC
jgi:hypothetical protein